MPQKWASALLICVASHSVDAEHMVKLQFVCNGIRTILQNEKKMILF